MDYMVHAVAKSWTQLSNFHFLFHWGFLHLHNNSGNVHQLLLSRYFREELMQRIGRKACPRKAPQGSEQLQFPVSFDNPQSGGEQVLKKKRNKGLDEVNHKLNRRTHRT